MSSQTILVQSKTNNEFIGYLNTYIMEFKIFFIGFRFVKKSGYFERLYLFILKNTMHLSQSVAGIDNIFQDNHCSPRQILGQPY